MSNYVLKSSDSEAEHSAEHSGVLEHDSPSFFQFLTKTFPAPTREIFERVYSVFFEQGKLELTDAQSDRTPRFNPAPCRVASLIVSECKDTDPEHLLAAMLQCFEKPDLVIKAEHVSAHTKNLALAALDFVKNPQPTDSTVERLGLALTLDRIRHLHLSAKTSAEQIAVCIRVQTVLIPETRSTENERLKILLNAACTRLLRIRGQREADS